MGGGGGIAEGEGGGEGRVERGGGYSQRRARGEGGRVGEAMDKGRVEEMRRRGGGGDGGRGDGDGRRGRRREGGDGWRAGEEQFGHQPHEPTSCPGPSIIPGVARGASARTHALVPEATPVPSPSEQL